ncbi:MAG TPA: phosphate ABC transporter permease subunit PstC [Solirubrobacteraceae bacterium]|jgi:phosphate ABC transporter permease protein PstC|nr:phosphate ABC transporter permease subunit PstC [Solirubrobacteraceae bacterium]
MAVASAPAGARSILERPPAARLPDRILRYGLLGLSSLILVLIVFFFVRLISEAHPAFSHFGLFGFTFGQNWNVEASQFHALPLVEGTIVTSAVALIIGVPVAVAAALFIVELCPRRLSQPLAILVDLLAAVPSVVYGLWGFFFLVPKLHGIETDVARALKWIPFIGGSSITTTGPNLFITGLVLAIMILPIVCAISREVISRVPTDHKEAALGLGATRWEMIRLAVLPYSRVGIVSGAMLGLGRAIGETIAAVFLLGDASRIPQHLFGQGYSLAAVIANEFGEAQGLHRSALFAAGLVLFVFTLLVNGAARGIVARSSRTSRVPAGGAGGGGASAAAAVGA